MIIGSCPFRSGRWLVSRRIFVPGYGSGTVYAFNRNLGFGASSHDIQFDADPEGQVRTIKLRRYVQPEVFSREDLLNRPDHCLLLLRCLL